MAIESSGGAAAAAAAATSSPAPGAAWRCPNDVLRRLFPPDAVHSLLGFLTSPAVGYTLADLLRPGDSDDYRHMLHETILVELQRVASRHASGPSSSAAAAATQTRAYSAARPSASFAFDHVSLATWTYVPACPRAADRDPAHKSDGMRSLLLHAIDKLLSKGQNVSVLTQGYAKVWRAD